MDRLTKIVVLGWTSAALTLEIWLLASGWSNLPLLSVGVAALMIGVGLLDRRAVALVLAVGYIFPALVSIWHGGAHYAPHEALWMVALVGVMFPDAIRSPWHIPAPWRAALIAAVLVVVVTLPIIILREIDLNPGLLTDMHGWNWGGATWPSIGVTWSVHVALTLVVGLLWFDWLLGARDLDFLHVVVTPLVISALVLAVVSIYQLLFDLRFLNETVFASIGRASGTMYDANVSGMIAAMWIGGSFLWARYARNGNLVVTLVVVIVNWLAVWATGSRTAFATAAIVTVCIGVSLVKEGQVPRARLAWGAGAFVAVLLAILAVAGMTNPRIVGPLGRVWATLPGPSIGSAGAFAAEMWNRNGYGTAATAMIRQSPLFGIGVGTYHTIAGDFMAGGLPPDNAQNWLRHQVVELGALGSLGWIVWFVAFGVYVVRTRQRDIPATWVTRGVLVGFGAMSMLGMPGQDVLVAITFWTIAFWHVSLVGRPADEQPLSRSTWIAVAVAVLVVAAGTTHLAMTSLRVPVRALTATWPYSYGFSSAGTAGSDEGYRQTRGHAVAVLDAPYQWLSVSVRLDHVADEPVDVRVWTNGAALLKGRLTGTGPLTAIIKLPAAPARVLLEAAARRADSQRPFAIRGSESLFLLKWEFLDRAPAQFNGYSRPISS